MNFAKIFQFETGQLLVTLDPNTDTEGYDIVFRSDNDELSASLKMKVPKADKAIAERIFADFDEQDAKERFDHLQDIISEKGVTNG